MAAAEGNNNFEASQIQPSTNGLPASALTRRRTGPRTRLGKERSKHNALKHGIFSKVVVLKGELQAEFDALLNGLCEDFRPVGAFEEGLVEMLAVTRWRQRRLLIAEGAEIQAGKEFLEWEEMQRQLVEAGRFSQLDLNGGLMRKIANPEAAQGCLDLLRELKERIAQIGFHPKGDEALLTSIYGEFDVDHWERTLFHSYRVCSQLASSPNHIRRQGELPAPEEYAKIFLQDLAIELRWLKRYNKDRALMESSRTRLEALRRNIPDSPRLDQLLRYAASLERAFDRTLSQLERAQRMRRGQPVAPRIDVNVSSS